jgi:ribosomal protein L11 methyltransferase
MRWLVLTVRSPSAETADLAEGLLALGASAVEELADGVRTWLPEPASLDALLSATRTRLGNGVRLEWELQEDQDWLAEWRRGLEPRRVGARIIVSPTWCEPQPDPADIVLFIDPQMAFGTGEHASTRGVLRLLERALHPGDRVLDVGTGSAILAIAAARLGAASVTAVESDASALDNAQDNVQRNGMAPCVRIVHGAVDDAFLQAASAQPYDVIVANVLSSVLQPLLPGFARALRAQGSLILGGVLLAEASAMRHAAHACGFRVAEEDAEDEWYGVWLYSAAS